MNFPLAHDITIRNSASPPCRNLASTVYSFEFDDMLTPIATQLTISPGEAWKKAAQPLKYGSK